jgi:hypothetical protein
VECNLGLKSTYNLADLVSVTMHDVMRYEDAYGKGRLERETEEGDFERETWVGEGEEVTKTHF